LGIKYLLIVKTIQKIKLYFLSKSHFYVQSIFHFKFNIFFFFYGEGGATLSIPAQTVPFDPLLRSDDHTSLLTRCGVPALLMGSKTFHQHFVIEYYLHIAAR
jgi:hypothetical protein